MCLHHAFAGSHCPQRILEDVKLASCPPTPCLTRRNSSASTISIPGVLDDVPPSPHPTVSIDPMDPAQPQLVLAPELRPKSPAPRPRSSTPASVTPLALQSLDPFEVQAELLELWRLNHETTVNQWNNILDKLVTLRKQNEQPTEILQAYNDMVMCSILPNAHTYMTLIGMLTTCDEEVYRQVDGIAKRIEKRHALGLSDHAENFVDQRRIEALCGEQTFSPALRLFTAASSHHAYMLPSSLYVALLNTCARHQNVKEAIRIFHYLEKRGVSKPSTSVHAHLLDMYMLVNDVKGACVVLMNSATFVPKAKFHGTNRT